MNIDKTKPNYYVASCSFWKDSLAMIIKIKELGLPLDEIIYAEVMFDDTLSGEMPKMAEWIPKAEQILLDKYGLKVTHLRAKKSFKEQFYTVKEKGKHIGDNYGFPYLIKAWCNSKLKVDNIKKHINQLKKNYNVKQYVGIAYDEPKRYERLDKNNFIAPLYDLKIVEKEAYEIAKEHNLLSPL